MTAKAVRTRVWRNGTLELENFPFEDVSDYLEQPDCLVWADLCEPTHELLCQLAEELNLDQHAVEDAIAEHERPKATRYATHLFLTTYAITQARDTQELVASRVSAFSLPHGFVTVRLDDNFDMDGVVRRWDQNFDLMKFGTKALIHGLLDEIVDGYFDAVERLDDEIEAIEDLLFDENPKVANELQRRTFALRKSLVQTRRVVLPMREVVNTVMRRATEDDHNAELAPYYEDLYDHVLRAAEWTESLRDII
jgi:magnesium transporter